MSTLDNLFIILRHANERTAPANIKRLNFIVEQNSFLVVTGMSFPSAHFECIKISQNVKQEFTLLIDGDVIFDVEHAKEVLKSSMQEMRSRDLMLNLPVIDRHFKTRGYAGVHLYRTKNLRKLKRFEKLVLSEQKPETAANKAAMIKYGLSVTNSQGCIFGFHGFEQFYADLYRTSYVRAFKLRYIFPFLLTRNLGETPGDRIIYRGLVSGAAKWCDGETFASLDKKDYSETVSLLLTEFQLEEISTISCEQLEESVKSLMENFRSEFYGESIVNVELRNYLFPKKMQSQHSLLSVLKKIHKW